MQRHSNTNTSPVLAFTLSTGVPIKRYKYCSKEQDKETGLYYYGARYYAPWLCRFNSVDPKALEYVHQSSYVFADNNPIVKYDVNGEGTNGDGTAPENQPQATNPPPSSSASSDDEIKSVQSGNILFDFVKSSAPTAPEAPSLSVDEARSNFQNDKSVSNYNTLQQTIEQWSEYNKAFDEYLAVKKEFDLDNAMLDKINSEVSTMQNRVLQKLVSLISNKHGKVNVIFKVVHDSRLMDKTSYAAQTEMKSNDKSTITIIVNREKFMGTTNDTDVTYALSFNGKKIEMDLLGTIIHELGHIWSNLSTPDHHNEVSERAARRWEALYYRDKYQHFLDRRSTVKSKDIETGKIVSEKMLYINIFNDWYTNFERLENGFK